MIIIIISILLLILEIILKKLKNKTDILIRMNIFIIIIISIFYFLVPLQENNKLILNSNFEIIKEPFGVFRVYKIKNIDNDLNFLFYIKGLLKKKDFWIGYIYDCNEIIDKIPYKELYPLYSGDDLDNNRCNKLKKYSGYFIIDKNKKINFNLTLNKIQEKTSLSELKLKKTNYYVQKYGELKGVNEFYFSGDSSVRMFQNPKKVKQKVIFIRNIIYIILFFSLIILIYLKNKNYEILKKESL